MASKPAPEERSRSEVPPNPKSGIRLSTPDMGEVYKLWEDENTEVSSTTALVPAATRAKGRPRLTVMTGIAAGRVVALDGKDQFVIGRGRRADIRIEDPGVSREHCRLVCKQDRFFLQDLSSRNGTVLNGDRIMCVPLHPGDRVQLGPNTVVQLGVFDETEDALARSLYEASTRDPLTRTFNRRYFAQRLDVEMAYARRHKTRLTVMLLDLDHFKNVNDSFGHAAGDVLLRTTAQAMGECIRSEDLLARFGGEEFALLVRETSLPFAQLCAERIRVRIAQARVPYRDVVLNATVSVGIAELAECAIDASGDEFVRLADTRLYRAKQQGRNRVVADAEIAQNRALGPDPPP
jgi:diguanylate cyclase (GGDEF)-like protein